MNMTKTTKRKLRALTQEDQQVVALDGEVTFWDVVYALEQAEARGYFAVVDVVEPDKPPYGVGYVVLDGAEVQATFTAGRHE